MLMTLRSPPQNLAYALLMGSPYPRPARGESMEWSTFSNATIPSWTAGSAVVKR